MPQMQQVSPGDAIRRDKVVMSTSLLDNEIHGAARPGRSFIPLRFFIFFTVIVEYFKQLNASVFYMHNGWRQLPNLEIINVTVYQ